MWRTLAEAGYKLLRKGKLVYVEGKARTRAFEDKRGGPALYHGNYTG
jgi:single-strand DNA-binding protein